MPRLAAAHSTLVFILTVQFGLQTSLLAWPAAEVYFAQAVYEMGDEETCSVKFVLLCRSCFDCLHRKHSGRRRFVFSIISTLARDRKQVSSILSLTRASRELTRQRQRRLALPRGVQRLLRRCWARVLRAGACPASAPRTELQVMMRKKKRGIHHPSLLRPRLGGWACLWT
jgi:hypothetical protein